MSEFLAKSPDDTFSIGEKIAESLVGGEVVMLYGGLGAGKTLMTKGILSGLDFDVDEVTSPSFTLVNLYKTLNFDVYHIDLWRLDTSANPVEAVGLGEILENQKTVTIIEWADRLADVSIPGKMIYVKIDGDGDEPRTIAINSKTND